MGMRVIYSRPIFIWSGSIATPAESARSLLCELIKIAIVTAVLTEQWKKLKV